MNNKFLWTIILTFCIQIAQAQHNYSAVIIDESSSLPISGATANINGKQAISNKSGKIDIAIAETGNYTVKITCIGYADFSKSIVVPSIKIDTILLTQAAQSMADITVVSTTRTNERIETATTKVEVLGLEEMNEEATIKPGNIASILGDVSGVQIQQSSQVTGNANIRIQGLDGKYTQILRDGMPLFGGYAGGFGILTIPPLDLKQIELIKGSASTLYGGGAIGGLVNLISKKPSSKADASFLINQSSLKETNFNAYYAQKYKGWGLTFFAGQNLQKQVDVNNDGLSDVPNTKTTVIHPTIFIYPSSKSTIWISWTGSFDKRIGGNMDYISGKATGNQAFFEQNTLTRNTFSSTWDAHLPHAVNSTLKVSYSGFNRKELTNTYAFTGKQTNFFSEYSLHKHSGKHNIVAGINFLSDKFTPDNTSPILLNQFSNTTAALFAQDSWQMLSNTKVETGVRLDHHTTYGNFVLPRIAIFHQINNTWGTRLGVGMGYITPNPLTVQITDYGINQLLPLPSGIQAEKSIAGNWEVNYKKELGNEASIFINHAFFVTKINQPIVGNIVNGNVQLTNQTKPMLTRGFDTYIRLHVEDWEWYAGYTYTEAIRQYITGNQFMPLTPRHRAATTLVYEVENNFRIGIEASFNGQQYRMDGTLTPSFFFMAAMIEKKLGPTTSLVLNGENLLDERQSRYEALYTGSITNPLFKPLWAPIDGRIINMSIRYQPFAAKHAK